MPSLPDNLESLHKEEERIRAESLRLISSDAKLLEHPEMIHSSLETIHAFTKAQKAQLTAKGSTLTSSMYRDLQKGNPVEADQIIGDLVVRAHRAQVTTPLLAAAFTHLSIYQKRIAES
jgi:ketopantoate reductase